MQRPDVEKQQEILQCAARLFAARPYHEVRLEDVAAAARVGKGTLYIYYPGKEALYLEIIRDGFGRVVRRIRDELKDRGGDPWVRLEAITDGLIDFAFTFPEVYRIMRSGVLTAEDAGLQAVRRQLTDEIERVIREGIETGRLEDPEPELTAQFMLSFIRGAVLYPPAGMTRDSLKLHILRLLRRGIAAGGAA
ncbi:MAG: TetR/AcrR family transcriptional regulator [Phycisphaerales bacterium]|nr:TetR/AcrR family transcriptional regulator [Phycisphaerales bacterium]